MKRLISCEYNFDNCCVELKFTDGSMIAIDTIAVENEVADNMYQRSELDYLIYNAPLEYADLILNGDPEAYLKSSYRIQTFRLKIAISAVSTPKGEYSRYFYLIRCPEQKGVYRTL